MRSYLISLAVGLGVGLIYGMLRVKSPAPPLVALVGLLGMVLGEQACERFTLQTRSPQARQIQGETIMSGKTTISAGYVDHVGMTVPDLTAALRFFEDAIGASLLWRAGPFTETPTGVQIKGVELAMLRLGPNLNLELLEIKADQQRREMPSNIDFGAMHIAFFVDDLDVAGKSLADHGATMLGRPIDAGGEAKKGERIWYCRTSWGAFLELVWRPEHLPYEQQTPNRLFTRSDIASPAMSGNPE